MASPNLPVPQSRRLAVLDIETVSLDPNDPRGALDAMTGRVVCIGLLFDDGQRLSPEPLCDTDEKRLLERFWATLRDTDLLIGHSILGFDLMFLKQRSWILNVKPPIALNLKRYYTEQVFDLMETWVNWSSRIKGASLDNIAYVLGCGQKTAHGSDVAAMWANRDFPSIVRYCMDDVWLSYKVYCRLTYRDPLGAPMPVLSAPQRELVPVAAQKPLPQAQPLALEAPLPAAAPAPRRRRVDGQPRPKKQITYVRQNGSLILAGDTFTLRNTLKQVFGARGSKDANGFTWTIGADKWESLAGLCEKAAIRLVPAGNGRAA